MENKLITNLYIKKARKDRTGKAPIYFRITVNGERAEISTNKKIEPENWDSISGRAIGRTESARMINAQLTNLKNKTEKHFLKLDNKGEIISVHQIVDELRGKSKNQMTLLSAYDHHNKRIQDLIGIDYSHNTIKRYKSSYNSLESFIKEILRKPDIRLCDLNHEFIEKYHTYLKVKKGLMHNSAAKNTKNLIRIINLSIQNSWITSNPFSNFSCSYKENYRECLTQEEIDKLYEKNSFSTSKEEFDYTLYIGFNGLAWSPDGKKLVYDFVFGYVPTNLLVISNADGSGEIEILATSTGEDKNSDFLLPSSPTWSPDGEAIYFTAWSYGEQHLYKIDLKTKNREMLLENIMVNSVSYYD